MIEISILHFASVVQLQGLVGARQQGAKAASSLARRWAISTLHAINACLDRGRSPPGLAAADFRPRQDIALALVSMAILGCRSVRFEKMFLTWQTSRAAGATIPPPMCSRPLACHAHLLVQRHAMLLPALPVPFPSLCGGADACARFRGCHMAVPNNECPRWPTRMALAQMRQGPGKDLQIAVRGARSGSQPVR